MALNIEADAAEAWRLIRGAAINAKRYAQAYSAELSAGDAILERVFEMYRNLYNIRQQIEAEKTITGLVEYVQIVRNDPAYDVLTDINAMTSAMQSALTWIDNNAAGLSLNGDTALNFLDSGSVVANRFTPTQTSGLRNQLDGIVAAIS